MRSRATRWPNDRAHAIGNGIEPMSESTGPKPPPAATPGRPDRRALVDAYRDLVKSEAERKAAGPEGRGGGGRRRQYLSLTLAALLVVAFVLRDQWLVSNYVPVQTPEVTEASMRMIVWKEARRIQLYQAAHEDALPDSATVAQGIISGVVFHPLGSGHYTLALQDKAHTVTYDSGDSLAKFLGNSYELIKRRPHK